MGTESGSQTSYHAAMVFRAPASVALLAATGLLVVAGCDRPRQQTSAASGSASVGLIPVTPDETTLLPPAPSGFEACREDLAVPLSTEAGRALLDAFREHPPTPSLAPAAAIAQQQPGELVISSAGRGPVVVRLGDQLDEVVVGSSNLSAVLASNREWDSHYADLLGAMLPPAALVAFAGEEPWDGGSLYTDLSLRIYVVAVDTGAAVKALRRDGGKALELLACAQPEEGGHRGAWSFRASEVGDERRLWLSTSLSYGDYGGIGTVELRVVSFGKGASLLLACMYEGRSRKACDDIEVAAPTSP